MGRTFATVSFLIIIFLLGIIYILSMLDKDI